MGRTGSTWRHSVALEGRNLVHYWAVPGKAWNRVDAPSSPRKATGPGSIAVGRTGNLEVVALEGSNLVHYWAVPGKAWNRVDPVITTKATGPGSIAVGRTGNLEVVVLEGSSLVHYWAVPGKAWNRVDPHHRQGHRSRLHRPGTFGEPGSGGA